MIVALEVPLALNLQRRAIGEVEAQAQAQASAIASTVRAGQRPSEDLTELVEDAARVARGRVIVVNRQGELIADSAGPGLVGTEYATPSRPEIVRALTGVPESREGFSETLGQRILATAAPILRLGETRGAVRITLSLEQVSAAARRQLLGLTAIGLVGLGVGLAIAFVLAASISRPLGAVAATARALGRGDLSARTGEVRGAREITEVARSFDEMAARLEETVRAQREFAGNASHQLRTPLTGLRLRIESAIDDAPPGLRPQLEAAQHEVDRLAAIVERLLVLARRAERGEGEEVDLGEAARRAVARWEERARAAGATLEVRVERARAAAASADVDQILDNLVDNGINHAPGPLVIAAGTADGRAFVAVEDRGGGIPEPERLRVTERFFRGRAARPGGSGLGLAIVRELAERWGGAVRVEARDGGGTRVEVRLPSAPTHR